jgi:hypothetical protein
MKRMCSCFDDPYALKSVYCSLVRSVLEYASVIWNPGYGTHSDTLESIQKKFILYALRYLPWRTDSFVLPNYESRCLLIALQTLSVRRRNAEVYFVFDVLTNRIDSPELLSLIALNAPPRLLRSHDFLHLPFQSTNYVLFSFVNRMVKSFNQFSHLFDFNVSRDVFRERIRSNHLPNLGS